MRKAWKFLLALVAGAAVWLFVFTGTPLFGLTLILKNVPVSAIELSIFSTNRIVSGPEQCGQVLNVMRKARAGPATATPSFGTLTIHYADGTTNRFFLQPGSRMGSLDLVDQTGSHTISLGKMFRTFQEVGLMAKDQR